MREEIIQIKKSGWFDWFFGLKEKQVHRYFFDSIKECLTSPYKEGVYILRDLTVERKTSQRIALEGNRVHTVYSTTYDFVLKDNSGQIRVESSPEFISIMFRRIPLYAPKTWSDIIAVREGDTVDIACENSKRGHLLTDLRNKSIEERVNESPSE